MRVTFLAGFFLLAGLVVACVLSACATSYHGNTAQKLVQIRSEAQYVLADCRPDGGPCPASQVRANTVLIDCLAASALADGKQPGGDAGPPCPKAAP